MTWINVVSTPPAAEPMYLDDAKLYLRVDHTDDDTLIAALIAAARQYAEDVTARAVVCQTRKLYLDNWPSVIVLPGPPAIEVSSIQYYDLDGSLQTLDTSLYDVDTDSTPGRITVGYGDTWPAVYSIEKAIVVTYICGYATPFSANATTDKLTWSGRAPADGSIVRVTNSGGALPGGLAAGTDYYIITSAAQTCELSLTSGGAKIDLTTAGTGQQFIGEIPAAILQAIRARLGMLYNNREGQFDEKISAAVDMLLWPYRMLDF
ncbi:MAG TPA: head-tail connector protein [Planctomycetota bacterium]|nr:head-tail connector protein [Planctomycetota bacterium]